EWMIYDRALNDEEREGVESQLVKKYLKPSVALTIDSATPQRNGVIPPARNTSIAAPKGLPKAPAEEFLAAFYLGAHGTLGHDLLQPARLGQRVMAWGNLAPGASADHLLAYQGGQDGHTPLLIRASAKEMPVIKDQWPLLRFAAGDTLEGKGSTSIQSKLDDRELTAYWLVRCTGDSGTLAEFETPTTTPALEIGYQAGKLSAAVLEGGGRKAATVSAAPTGEWSLIGMTWNGQEKKLRLWTVAPGGVRSAPGEVDSPVDTLAIDGYRIGKAGGAFSGDIGAVMIYRKALDETQQRAVEDYLRGQVFAK
ncbi:MAG: hypothetical protein KDM64_12850, partial [Verrucomicrobiae bacterium]|nr:hypothetical protein [Verrucomicrobiae bacterium]